MQTFGRNLIRMARDSAFTGEGWYVIVISDNVVAETVPEIAYCIDTKNWYLISSLLRQKDGTLFELKLSFFHCGGSLFHRGVGVLQGRDR